MGEMDARVTIEAGMLDSVQGALRVAALPSIQGRWGETLQLFQHIWPHGAC